MNKFMTDRILLTDEQKEELAPFYAMIDAHDIKAKREGKPFPLGRGALVAQVFSHSAKVIYLPPVVADEMHKVLKKYGLGDPALDADGNLKVGHSND